MIERYIYVTRESIIQPIYYVENTNMIPIILHITDYDLPEDAVARAYAGVDSRTVILCEISGNNITIPVVSGFFKTGKNILQIRIVQGEDNLLISFPIPVNVRKDITGSDAEEPVNNPGTMDQLAAKYGEIQGKVLEIEEVATDALLKSEENKKSITNVIKELDELKRKLNNIETVDVLCDYLNSGNSFKIYKRNGLCAFALTALSNLPINTSQVIAVIPEGFRSVMEIAQNVNVPNSTKTINLSINSNGEIRAYNYTDSTGTINVRAIFNYICSD